ncbi:MAG: 2-nitropropane dioxygenase [Linnemannia elongata]|nr:MAG: 2-nitropropane dioxygenase [Linnemannia elongata]
MSPANNQFLSLFSHITRRTRGVGLDKLSTPWFTKPIASAPMNGWSGPKLVAAVANHGGVPIYPIGYFTDPAAILKDLQSILPLLSDNGQQQGDIGDGQGGSVEEGAGKTEFLPYAVGFITFWLDRQGPELLIKILEGQGDLPNPAASAETATIGVKKALRPPAAVWFSFGDYRPYLKLVRQHGAAGTRVIVQVQTVQEAIDAQQEGVDVVVLQGTESGGHGAQRVRPLLSFIPEVVEAFQERNKAHGFKVPAILAAGGISVNSQWRAVQSLGASGVVIGTGFMPTFESPGPEHAKARILNAGDGGDSTVRTRIFDELREFGWPEGYDGRVIRNLVTDREEEDLKTRGVVEPKGAEAFKVLREDRTGTKEDWKRAVKDQDLDFIPLWAGTGVGLLKKQMSAAEWMDQLLGESEKDK